MRVEEKSFIFSHNGEDFTEEHFASLCRFGYSNKRALHTIGFRGIGFKSTFSLGDTVELYTPTLSVSFQRTRFTEPRWLGHSNKPNGLTYIIVAISDDYRQREVEKNLEEWLKSPVSLLFFKHIRRLRIGGEDLYWHSLGPGPVADTEWMALRDEPKNAFLVVRSGSEAFPSDALDEIRQERLLGTDQDSDFPPCKVEIVLGAKGRLYVVLPTGVETELPFACNAPFIQDPARLKIKDTETSPTNRWLLGRIGTLAGSVVQHWLEQSQLDVADRSRAYGMYPDADSNDSSLEGTCAATVGESFDDVITGKAILLTNLGELKLASQSVVIPEELFDVWSEEQAAALLDVAGRPAFSRHVSIADRKKLVRRGVLEELSKDDVVNVLQTRHLPKPETWRRLLNLWAYVAPEITGYRRYMHKEEVRIVPVQGKDVLYSANEVVRLGEKKLLQSDADWEFLAQHLLVLNQNWPRFLAEQRRNAEEDSNEKSEEIVEAAFAILDVIGLEETSDVSKVVERVSLNFFNQKSITLLGCIQLTQIAAKLGASIGESYRFVTWDQKVRSISNVVVCDQDGALESLFPDEWCQEHLLHPDYTKSFGSCTSEDWIRWIASGRSGLHTFAPLIRRERSVWKRSKIENELDRRGFRGAATYPYVGQSFVVEDWDFDESHWDYWTALAKNDQILWGRLINRFLAQPDSSWQKTKNARALQIATTGSKKAIVNDPLLPSWVLNLRELPCLPDTRGFYHKPSDLLRRTPETEAFMDIEPFIHGRLDTEANRLFLKLLGVRDTPTGPDRLLDCLRALARADNPPVYEVEKWYRRLDQMVSTCSTTDLANIKKALREEKILLTENAGWVEAQGVFLLSDEEDVPGAPVIRASVRDLSLWRKMGIAERPTADLAIQWLKELPSGKVLLQDEARRVRALLARHAVRIWNECGHWLNLAGEWVPVDTLYYALSMQSLLPWSHLHEWVKKKTADLQRLSAEITAVSPFSDLPHLANHIEDRFHRNPLPSGHLERKPWLNQLGLELRRIELDDEAETARIRTLASKLAETMWESTSYLEIVPYIDGTPSGTPRRTEVAWLDNVIYVDVLPNAKLARVVPEKLGKEFGRSDIAAALNYCFGRLPEEVTEYLEENFRLAPREESASQEMVVNSSSSVSTAPDTATPSLAPSEEQSDHQITVPEDMSDGKDAPERSPSVEQVELDQDVSVLERTRPHSRPAKPNIIERFSLSQGFQKDGENRFFHADGSWIAKTSGDVFPWERRNATGEIVRYFWPKEHCLERDPFQLEADVWGLIESFPELYALVLSNLQGDPIEIPGARLLAMRDDGELKLYPATYRLVLDHAPKP